MEHLLNSCGNYDHALLLADKLRAHWAKKGKLVRVWIDTIKPQDSRPMYMMRSNLMNGFPREEV